jgi:acyl carrier protein
MVSPNEIADRVKAFILREFLAGEDPDELTPTTPLVTAGILDSLGTLRLVTFLEETYDITIEAHEADADNLNTIESITRLVSAKL